MYITTHTCIMNIRKILNNYTCKKNVHVLTDTYAFSIDLAQRNRKKSINIRYPLCVNLWFASDSPGRTPEESRVKLEKSPCEPRADEKWGCQKAILRFGLNLKNTS